MRIFLEATEPLLFRTGRSFNAGEGGFVETLFPPTPETLQGAIRAMIATYKKPSATLEEAFSEEDLTNLIGSRDKGYGRFRICGLAIGRRKNEKTVERLFKAPSHLVTVTENNGNEQRILLKPQEMPRVKSSDFNGARYYLLPAISGKGKTEAFEHWLTETGLEKVLQSKLELADDEVVREEQIYQREYRLGIGMDNTKKVTREGFLYQLQVVRLQPNYGFVIDIHLHNPAKNPDAPYLESLVSDEETRRELDFLPESGWILLGGERRTARFQILPTPSVGIEQKRKGKLLYLATPSEFDGGWLPSAPTLLPITAAIKRYQAIGGWELDPKNSGEKIKTMQRFVPAGSVYFFEEAVEITQPWTEYGKEIGYGITYAGEWQS